MLKDVLVESGRIATVTINRPERRNALTVEVTKQIAAALEEAAGSSRVIVLTGAGPAFCAGGDFEELARLSEVAPGDASDHLYEGFQKMILTVRRVGVPVVAAVNGPAMGAGLDLALACDLRVASVNARLGQVWARLGLIPGTGGAFWTTHLAGPARAARMLLTGEPVDAATALEWGLVDEVVEPGRVVARALELAEAIAANPPEAVAANKRALDELVRPAYEAALDYARRVQAERFGSDEFKEALRQEPGGRSR
jgi:2-(1,2-epoxy-1,2-dihydrophenyl)acetyl-CoA isomerase